MTSLDQPRREVYDLVLGFAGRLPDEDLAAMRSALAEDETELVVDRLRESVGEEHLALTPDERDRLRRFCAEYGLGSESVDELDTGSSREIADLSVARYTFGTADFDDEWADDVDEAVIGAAIGLTEDEDFDEDAPLVARAMWRVRRDSADESTEVRLVELLPDADPVEITGRIHEAVSELDEDPSCIEVFAGGTQLTRYHEEALASATLIWVAEELVIPRVAAVYDGVNPHGEPFFAPDHARIPEAEQAELIEYLRGGERILGSLGWISDIVTSEEVCVPTGYRSDGTWVWPDATLYYLERHGLAPDPDFRAHMREAGAPARVLSRLQRHAVLDALLDREPRLDPV